jgi:hypothetical protein
MHCVYCTKINIILPQVLCTQRSITYYRKFYALPVATHGYDPSFQEGRRKQSLESSYNFCEGRRKRRRKDEEEVSASKEEERPQALHPVYKDRLID